MGRSTAASSTRRFRIPQLRPPVHPMPAPRPVMRAVIRTFARKYGVDAAEAERAIEEYPTFTEFFTRRLKPGARPIAPGELVPVSPVDGTVGEVGEIVEGMLLQAKGKHYTLAELLGGPEAA